MLSLMRVQRLEHKCSLGLVMKANAAGGTVGLTGLSLMLSCLGKTRGFCRIMTDANSKDDVASDTAVPIEY